jgi:uncharacterized protein YegL
MKENSTLIVFMLDKSGSMQKGRQDTIGGFNSFITKQRSETTGEVKVTLIQFDDQYEVNFSFVPIHNVWELSERTYVPRGWTALVDAMCKAIDDTGAKLAAMNEEERPSKVIFVTITDGAENSSYQFTTAQLKTKIQHQEQKYSWVFMYLGANQDSFAQAAQYGYKSILTGNWSSSNIGGAYTGVSAVVSNYSNTGNLIDLNTAVNGSQNNNNQG